MSRYKLYYFNIYGRAELSRLIFHYNRVPFEDIRLNYQDWQAFKKRENILFGQLPLLEIDDKKRIVQSQVIARYLTQVFGQYPKDLDTATKVEEIRKFVNYDVSAKYSPWDIKDPQQKEEHQKNFFEKLLPQKLQYLEAIVKANPTGFLVGDSITLADFALMEYGQRMLYREGLADKCKLALEQTPKLVSYFEERFKDPKFKEYLEKRIEQKV